MVFAGICKKPQVQLVELLQFIRRRKPVTFGFRIGGSGSSSPCGTSSSSSKKRKRPTGGWPNGCLSCTNTSRASSDTVPFRVYGVSVQGGDLEEEAEQLRKSHRSPRIRLSLGLAARSSRPMRRRYAPARFRRRRPGRGIYLWHSTSGILKASMTRHGDFILRHRNLRWITTI